MGLDKDIERGSGGSGQKERWWWLKSMIRSSDIGINQHEQSKLRVENSFHVEFFVT